MNQELSRKARRLVKNLGKSDKVQIYVSDKPEKKFFALLNNVKRVYFGANGYEDYTTHKDDVRRERFRTRFRSLYDKNKTNLESPLFWSWNLLW